MFLLYLTGEDLDDISGVKTFIASMAKAYIRRLPKNSGERALPCPAVNENKPRSKLVDSETTQDAGLPGTGPHPQTFDASDVPCLLLGHPDMEYRLDSLCSCLNCTCGGMCLFM